MYSRISLLAIIVLCCLPIAFADAIEYDVSINTSSISGTAGSLDFNFDPGAFVSQPAMLQILSFTGDGVLAGGALLTGDVNGGLPATVLFDNGTGYNDYFQGFTFGTTISFVVNLYGPALSSPDGTSTSGSAFVFSMFSDPSGTYPVLTSDQTDGFALKVDVNLDGTTTVVNYSPETTIGVVSGVPEPSTFVLISSIIGLTGFARWFRRRI